MNFSAASHSYILVKQVWNFWFDQRFITSRESSVHLGERVKSYAAYFVKVFSQKKPAPNAMMGNVPKTVVCQDRLPNLLMAQDTNSSNSLFPDH